MTQTWIARTLEKNIADHILRGKSILLLGPRQTGKTSLLKRFEIDLTLNFLLHKTRLAYEKNPDLLVDEIAATPKKNPLILIDEVQKVPAIFDVVQYLADERKARFILTGSSSRKLGTKGSVNLLPGRVVSLRLDPLTLSELEHPTLETLLLFGSLPQIYLEKEDSNREIDLESYVMTFLEEEIRKEALVRNVPGFARFLELAAIDSGRISNFSEISKQIGIAHTTIASHYQILDDCLIVERFDPITKSKNRKKLTRSSKYVFFDLGVRRLAAGEGTRLNPERMGELFEQFIGLELRRLARTIGGPGYDVRFWRDPDGPEVDWVLENKKELIPIEVKWTEQPQKKTVTHLEVFLDEYKKEAHHGYVVCRTPRPFQLSPRVTAIPWQDLPQLFTHRR